MAFASTAPLRREIEARIPERPFTVEFWDGTRLPASNGDGPTFYVRSPRAAAHVLRAPGQLGLGRAYVSGEIEVDDIDAVIELLDGWQPPALEGADKARAAARRGARRRASRDRRRRPAAELRPSGHRHSKERDAARRAPPLRRLQRVLLALPRRLDDLQLRGLRATGQRRWRRPRRRSSRWSPASWRCRRATGCSTSAAAGAASRSGPRPGTAPASSASPSPPPRPRRPASGPRRPGSPTGSRSG